MRRYEDYSCWSRYLPLVNWMTKTLGRIIEKEISSPDICCRNVQFEIKLLNITHTWCSSVLARSLNKAIRKKPSITQYELRKTSIKFHIPSLNKCQLVSLIFKNIESVSWDGQKLFQFPLPEKSLSQILFSSYKISKKCFLISVSEYW